MQTFCTGSLVLRNQFIKEVIRSPGCRLAMKKHEGRGFGVHLHTPASMKNPAVDFHKNSLLVFIQQNLFFVQPSLFLPETSGSAARSARPFPCSYFLIKCKLSLPILWLYNFFVFTIPYYQLLFYGYTTSCFHESILSALNIIENMFDLLEA